MTKIRLPIFLFGALLLCVVSNGLAVERIPYSTGISGGLHWALGAAVARVLNQYLPAYSFIPETNTGSTHAVRLLESGEVVLANAIPEAVLFAMKGEMEFKKKHENLRTVLAGPGLAVAIVVLADSPIRMMRDLKGKKVAPGGTGTAKELSALFELYGISKGDYIQRILSYSEMAQALKDRTIDAGFFSVLPRNSTVIDLATSYPVRFIPIEDETAKAYSAKYPYWTPLILPAGTYKGQTIDVKCPGLYTLLMTNKMAGEKLIYEVTRTVLEHANDIGKIHTTGFSFTAENLQHYLVNNIIAAPFHPGAAQFLKEKGILK